jgi:hypothetical protein
MQNIEPKNHTCTWSNNSNQAPFPHGALELTGGYLAGVPLTVAVPNSYNPSSSAHTEPQTWM